MVELDLVSDTTMRTALALILIVVTLLTLMIAKCAFKEMPIERRKEYYNLKRRIKDSDIIEQKVIENVQKHTLSASEEWIRMKNEEPNIADVRATK